MRLARPIVFSVMIVSLLGSCSLAPDYFRPATPTPVAFKEHTAANGWIEAEPAASQPRGEWWRVFNDPILDLLESEVTDANQNLRAALASYDQARAEVDAANSALFPVLEGSASSTRERESHNRPLFGATSPSVYSDHIVSLDASYDIDVFGRLRNALSSAEANEAADADDVQALNLTLHSDLASDYFQLREQDALVRLYADTVTYYKQALDLTQQRFDAGIAAAVDVAQAQAQLQLAIAAGNDVMLARARLEHAIALLVGEASSTFTLQPGAFNPEPPVIPVGLPSELLQRRPDIAANERRVAAANADIGVAASAFYPDFQFNLEGGFESNKLADWIKAPSRFWSIGPASTLEILDAGERDAILAEAGAAYDEAVANYRQSVLTGYKDVEDALASIRLLDAEALAEDKAVKAAQDELNYANDRYANGVNTYLEVVTAQTTLLQAERAEEDVLASRLNARVSLIRALGGYWGPVGPLPDPNPDPASFVHADEPGSIFTRLFQ